MRRLHRIESRLCATGGFATAREIAGFEKVAVKLWRVQFLSLRARAAYYRLDKQLRIAIRFCFFEIASRRAPKEFHFVGGQAFVSRTRIVCFRLRRAHRDHRATTRDHVFQQTVVALRLKINVQRVAAADLHVGITFERARGDVGRGKCALETLVLVHEEIHVDGMDFRGTTGIHHAHVGVAANLGPLQMLLLVDDGSEVIAAENVGLLFDCNATGKSEHHRLLIKYALRRLDRDRTRTLRRLRRLSRRDRQLDITS